MIMITTRLILFAERNLGYIATILILFKLFLVADIPVHIRYSPFDDSLYVTRAYEYLQGINSGAYDPFVLSKLPGMPMLLVVLRLFGMPYLFVLNLLYCLIGFIFVRKAAQLGVNILVAFFSYIVFLFNPITFSVEWSLVMREPMSSILFTSVLTLSLYVIAQCRYSLTVPVLFSWAVVFGLSLILREEDKLLWSYLALLLIGSYIFLKQSKPNNLKFTSLLLLIGLSIFSHFAFFSAARFYVKLQYGAPIINDYSEGEFPKLMASIRSIESSVDNRLVMMPQDVTEKLKILVPQFSPVIEKLPAPGVHTFSCKLHGVCTEWSNGWMPWWVKLVSWEAGMTPTLVDGQNYFRSIREQIDALCSSEALKCHQRGAGIIPTMELRWFRAYIQELQRLLAMTLYPPVNLISEGDRPILAASGLVKKFQLVTMTAVTENALVELPQTMVERLRFVIRDWIAISMIFLNTVLFTLSTIALILRWVAYPRAPLTSIVVLCTVFWLYSAIRLMALAYVAVFLGPFEPRIIFSTYTGLQLLSIFAIWDMFQARKIHVLKG